MTWFEHQWKQLRFNRLNFERNYVVDQVLSEKPRSRVMLTRRHGGSRRTIMKLCDPAAANPLEVQCLRSVRHPGVACYLGHGFTRRREYWIETEYVDGVPLSSWLDERSGVTKQADADRGRIFLQLLATVQYLHCCGWIHGDLSPQNVLVCPTSCRVVLVDFEHASVIGSASTNMRRKHSLDFASPREIIGGKTTESCEQFALGKLGTLVFGHYNGEGRERFQAILARATSHRPEDRYPDLRALVRDVESAMKQVSHDVIR
ncbi:MAG: protein kinase [Planctomycetota bacterium]